MSFVGNLDNEDDWVATDIAMRMGQPEARGMDADTFLRAFRLGFLAGHCQARIVPHLTTHEAYQHFTAGKS